jgi:anthranilate/para-aminobenzoate synthase component I
MALPVESSGELCPEGGVGLGSDRGSWGGVPRWVGLLPYEAARHLERSGWSPAETREPPHHLRPCWFRYGAVLVVDHLRGEVHAVGEEPALVRQLARLAASPEPRPREIEVSAGPAEPLERHATRVREALELILQGDLYQVNLARRLEVTLRGDPFEAFVRLSAASPASYAASIEWPGEAAVFATSPELFLDARTDGKVFTLPIKGTRPRGRDALQDAALRAELDADPKEIAELSMVIDLERNDLGKLAEVGSVRVPAPPVVRTHRTLHHRVARVEARLPRGVSWANLVAATFPSGSVTGAPKVRAMEVIARLEAARRGLYTGAFGHVSHGGDLVLAMAIRTLTAQGEGEGPREGHYHTGGGIVADSDPGREVDETRVKSLQLLSLLRGG